MDREILLGAYVFILAIFLGLEVINRVPATLHTPLMSGTNAIHGIVLLGAMLVLGTADSWWLQTIGFVAVVLGAANVFIYGLKMLSSPATARRGNQVAAIGMAIAVLATFLTRGLDNIIAIVVGILAGGALGYFPARTVKMTAMPQMVAIFNGTGGATA